MNSEYRDRVNEMSLWAHRICDTRDRREQLCSDDIKDICVVSPKLKTRIPGMNSKYPRFSFAQSSEAKAKPDERCYTHMDAQ
jgi:hypothetical protein